jgi:hypothetical protein
VRVTARRHRPADRLRLDGLPAVFRRGGDGGARVLGELKAGDSVFVLGKTGDWLGIDYDTAGAHSRMAFVHKDHVSIA